MMQQSIFGSILALGLLTSGVASAQEFADKGTLAFSGDRLFGVYVTSQDGEWDDWDGPDPWDDWDYHATEVGFMMQGQGITPYTQPRLSVDYFVIDHLSLGGTLGYFSFSGDDDGDLDDDDDAHAFFFGPRIGGAWMFNDWAGIWARGGLSYLSWGDDDTDGSQFFLTAEGAFILSPTDGFAFTLGPAFDIGLTGKLDPDGPREADLRMNSFGIVTVGVMGYLNL